MSSYAPKPAPVPAPAPSPSWGPRSSGSGSLSSGVCFEYLGVGASKVLQSLLPAQSPPQSPSPRNHINHCQPAPSSTILNDKENSRQVHRLNRRRPPHRRPQSISHLPNVVGSVVHCSRARILRTNDSTQATTPIFFSCHCEYHPTPYRHGGLLEDFCVRLALEVLR